MGWVAFVVLAVAVIAALVLLRVGRMLWTMVGAALMLGAAGYAWQGRPTLPARPVQPNLTRVTDDPSLIALREAMFGRFTADAAYLTAADAMTRAGDNRSAVRAILGGINRYPHSAMLWTALGTSLSAHDGNTLSPPAAFAFQQAIRLAPQHPGPRFFLGLEQVRSYDFAAARGSWAAALALSPPGASYRRDIALRLMLVDQMTRRGAR